MEESYDNTRLLKKFSFRSRRSPFLPDLLPLLEMETAEEKPHLQRISNHKEGLQMLWSQHEEFDPYHAQLCLTLSRKSLSLTIATCYNTPIEPHITTRSTLVIQGRHNSLHTTNKFNGVAYEVIHGKESIQGFAPRLHNTLVNFGFKEGEHMPEEPARRQVS